MDDWKYMITTPEITHHSISDILSEKYFKCVYHKASYCLRPSATELVFICLLFMLNTDCKDGRHNSSPEVKPKHLIRPLLAGCSIGHKPCPLHVSQIIFPKSGFCHLR